MNTYTHGHAEAVLRSHRWRTAANSAAYLLPHLHAGQRLLDVGSGPGTITADLARLVAEVVAVEVSEEAADLTRAELERQGDHPRDRRRRRRARPRPRRRLLRRRARPPGPPARRRPGRGAARDAARDPSRRPGRRARQRLRPLLVAPRLAGPRPLARAVRRRGARQRRRAARRADAAGVGARRRCHRRRRELLDVVLRRPGGPRVVGEPVGRPASPRPRSRASWSTRAGRRPRSWPRSRPRGAAGPRTRTAGSPCCTARCSSGRDPGRRSRRDCR